MAIRRAPNCRRSSTTCSRKAKTASTISIVAADDAAAGQRPAPCRRRESRRRARMPRAVDPARSGLRRRRAGLNERFGSDWRYEVAEQQRDGDEAIVLCKLTFGKEGAVRTQFGRAKIPSEARGRRQRRRAVQDRAAGRRRRRTRGVSPRHRSGADELRRTDLVRLSERARKRSQCAAVALRGVCRATSLFSAYSPHQSLPNVIGQAPTPFSRRGWRKAPAIANRLVRVRFGAFGRMIMPPPAAGADEFGGHGHRSTFLLELRFAFNHYLFAPLNSPDASDSTVDAQRCSGSTRLLGGCAGRTMLTMFCARSHINRRCAPGSGTAAQGRSGDSWRA